jgi:transcriptional regulator with XRE-family HTH domain
MVKGSLLDFVLHGLEQHRGSWPEIAKVTGVPYSAICKLAQKQHPNPRLTKLERLAAYLKRAA